MKTNLRLCASVLTSKKTNKKIENGGTISFCFDEDSGGANLSVVEFGLEYAYSDKHKDAISDMVAASIKKVGDLTIQSNQKVLFIGVGNSSFTADCLGFVFPSGFIQSYIFQLKPHQQSFVSTISILTFAQKRDSTQ